MSDRPRLTSQDILSAPETFPNELAELRLSMLVGLDDHIEALERDLRLIYDPTLARDWCMRQYGEVIAAVKILEDAVPLIVFEGDVGTGKTALAETIGQRVASNAGYGVHLIKMSTRVRGTGYVGEMGTLLAESFERVESLFKRKGEPVLFVIDEADSVLTSRAAEQHHHEDKSGVNTILQHLDTLRNDRSQIAVLAITNRIGALDPAVLRRATAVFKFRRPDCLQRAALLNRLFGKALSESDVELLVEASERSVGGDGARDYPLSYSDLALRFAAPSVRRAVSANQRLEVATLAETLRHLKATPPMSDT